MASPPKPLPSRPQPSASRRSIMTVMMVIIIGLLLSGFLLILPGFIGPAIVAGALFMFGMIGFHYIVWGRWMTRVLRDEALDEADGD